jgi:hypothetical protein
VSLFLRGLLIGLAAVSCRRFELCGADSDGCAVTGGGGDSGEGGATDRAGGTGGTSGSAGAESCLEPIQSCDESSVNGCETDTRVEPLHCGRCRNACSACGLGRCIDVEQLDDYPCVRNAGIAQSSDHLYFLAKSSSTQQTVLRRIAKANGEVVTVLEGLNRDDTDFTGLAVGLDRVYLVNNGALWSVSFSGNSWQDEHLPTAVPPVANGAFLYAWSTDRRLLRRDLTSDREEELEPWPSDAVSFEAHLAVLDDKLVFVGVRMEDEVDDESRWELRLVTWPDSEPIASGRGKLTRVRTFPNFDFDVVWLVDRSESDGPSELWGYTLAKQAETLIAVEDEFTDFCLSEGLLYAVVSGNRWQGLRALSRTVRPFVDIGLRQQIGAPTCDGDVLYFFDLAAPGVFRMNVGKL